MKKVVLASLVCAAMIGVTTIQAQAKAMDCDCGCGSNDGKGVVAVSYTAEKEVAPDVVEISFAVKTYDKSSMEKAATENKIISENVYKFLKESINPENKDFIKTANYSARPFYSYDSGKRKLDKYEVSNNIVVRTKSLDKVSTLIDKSIALGATNVDSLRFSLSEKDSEYTNLYVEATKKARERAEAVAQAAGASVVGVKRINTTQSQHSGYGFANRLYMNAMPKADAAESVSTPIEAGVVKLHSNVNAVFYIK